MEQRVLVAEDDPTSAEFFRAALEPLGCVRLADRAEALLRELDQARFDLLVLDDHLGSVRGDALLAAIRQRHGPALPILLVSAELPDALDDQRRAQGADACLAKPMSRERLWQALAPLVPELLPVWDEAAAQRALCVDASSRQTLRGLFLAELPAVRERVRSAVSTADLASLQAELHRLRAACGFCGAGTLGAVATALGADATPAALRSFESACDRLLDQGASP